jgi:hypothetical protein
VGASVAVRGRWPRRRSHLLGSGPGAPVRSRKWALTTPSGVLTCSLRPGRSPRWDGRAAAQGGAPRPRRRHRAQPPVQAPGPGVPPLSHSTSRRTQRAARHEYTRRTSHARDRGMCVLGRSPCYRDAPIPRRCQWPFSGITRSPLPALTPVTDPTPGFAREEAGSGRQVQGTEDTVHVG